jgi:tRNA (guanine37-N1)-methyltransferase
LEIGEGVKAELDKEYSVPFTYDNYNMSDALKVILPDVDEREIPSGFEIIGDIAHLNLQNQILIDHRFEIGQVVLDKNTTIKTVVRKVGQIESQFRFYNLECIAGDKDNYETI